MYTVEQYRQFVLCESVYSTCSAYGLFQFVSAFRGVESVDAKVRCALSASVHVLILRCACSGRLCRYFHVFYSGCKKNGTNSEMVCVKHCTHSEMVCMPISMRRKTGGSATVAPYKQAHGRLANTLLCDIGCRYIVRPVQQENKTENDSLLSNDHILYAKKVCIRSYYSMALDVLQPPSHYICQVTKHEMTQYLGD